MLPIVLIATAIAALPHINAEKICRGGPVDTLNDDYKTCIESERTAESALQQKWAQYPAKIRRECVNALSFAPEASYVELQTCIESQTKDADSTLAPIK